MYRTRMLALVGAGAMSLVAARAVAQVSCDSLPNPVYITGSTAVQNVIAGIGSYLYNSTSFDGGAGLTLIYDPGGSCAGLQVLVSDPSTVAGQLPTSKPPVYYPGPNPGDAGVNCTLPSPTPAPDIVASDVFVQTCINGGGLILPDGGIDFQDVHGPTQSMLFIQQANVTGSEQAISASQAYYVLGFGPNGGDVAPWNAGNENDTTAGDLFVRSASSGTQEMISTYIDLLPTIWLGISESGTGGVITGVSTAASDVAAATLGIASADAVDPIHSEATPLAFEAFGQTAAYFADSSLEVEDKQNTRDGHYQIEGPLHLVALTNGTQPSSPTDTGPFLDQAAVTFIKVLTGQIPLTGNNVVAVEASKSTVPDCAMEVTHVNGDGSSLAPYTPAQICGCYFQTVYPGSTFNNTTSLPTNSTTQSTCVTCTSSPNNFGSVDVTCPVATPVCNFGFCEAQ